MREINALFLGPDIGDVLRAHEQKLFTVIDALEPQRILGTNPEELADYFEREYVIQVPQLKEAEITADQHEAQVDMSHDSNRFIFDRSRLFHLTGTQVSFYIPFIGDKNLFTFRPSTYSLGVPAHGVVFDNELVLNYARTDHDANAVKASVESDLGKIRTNLDRLRSDVGDFNSTVRDKAKSRIEARRQKLLRDQGLVASLGFPLHHRADAPQTYVLPTVRRKPPVRRHASPPAAPFVPEPELDMAEYEHILSVISKMVDVMERSPHAFCTLGEEDLRWHFLIQLNGQYEGQATGETFNFHGKTDILIRADDKNVFIAECKFWDGPKTFTAAIDQLLGYTAWRDTKTALLIFNRRKNFSGVLAQIPGLVRTHPNYKRDLPYTSETGFRFNLHHRDDTNQELILTVLAFEIPG